MRQLTSDVLAIGLGFVLTATALTSLQAAPLTLAAAQGPILCSAAQFGAASIGWDQEADSLGTAQAGPYTAVWDGGAAHPVPVSCSGTASPFQCQALAKDLAGTTTPGFGSHTFTVSTVAGVSIAQQLNVTGIGIPKNFRLILVGMAVGLVALFTWWGTSRK